MRSITFLCLVIASIASAQSWIKKNTETLIIPASMSSVLGTFKDDLIQGNAKSFEEKFRIISEMMLNSEKFNIPKDTTENTYTYVELKGSDKKTTDSVEAFVIQRTGQTLVTNSFEENVNAVPGNNEKYTATVATDEVPDSVLDGLGIWGDKSDSNTVESSTKAIKARIDDDENVDKCECIPEKNCEGSIVNTDKCTSSDVCCLPKDHIVFPECNAYAMNNTWNLFVKGKQYASGFLAVLIHPRAAIASSIDVAMLKGGVSLIRTYGAKSELKAVKEIVTHFTNDVSILIWDQPLKITTDVIPACLPSYTNLGAFTNCQITKFVGDKKHPEEAPVSISKCSDDDDMICYQDAMSYECTKLPGALTCNNPLQEIKILGFTPQSTQVRNLRRCPMGGNRLKINKISPVSLWIQETLLEKNVI